ncbi:unnamed protein product [Clonostachys rosea f. rosea IK726]|uniref:Zn(2)-C6 fungal-type domain-containing protein n=2 Tax=Bionectria ochroleuca TaxID=29856 RepID=A0A0B7KFX9_BIOOC|nr:unnamed protein product [Clonostachys rosea f. rosea IK726]
MPQRKRPYRPKVKGCYECSQRRVSCDRTTPQCNKCRSKGLICSGSDAGIRYRFTQGVSTRGKWRGHTIQSLCENRLQSHAKVTSKHESSSPRNLPEGLSSEQPSAGHNSAQSPRQETSQPIAFGFGDENLYAGVMSPLLLNSFDDYTGFFLETTEEASWTLQTDEREGSSKDTEHHSLSALESSIISPVNLLLTESLLDDVPSWKKALLMHYSEHIASEMLAIDGSHNGWRYIVLPLAHTDNLVMEAVLAVSAFHRDAKKSSDWAEYIQNSGFNLQYTSQQQSRWLDSIASSPQTLYNTAIKGLRRRSNLAGSSYEAKQAILVAVLVLLVAAMVTGRDDYFMILGMLHSATDVFKGEDELWASELGRFLARQVQKMRVYAAPHISEMAGLETLTSQSQWDQYFDCVRYCSQSQSQGNVRLAAIEDVMQQAHDIYLQGLESPSWALDDEKRRAADTDPEDRIERFKITLEQLPADGPGAHVLVWAIFLVAAASSSERHRAFFKEVLLKRYSQSRFANLLKGIKHLPQIWVKTDNGIRWTQLLSEARLFVM